MEEYESVIIDRYHCPKCEPMIGPSKSIDYSDLFRISIVFVVIVKVEVNDHRHSYEDNSQNELVSA